MPQQRAGGSSCKAQKQPSSLDRKQKTMPAAPGMLAEEINSPVHWRRCPRRFQVRGRCILCGSMFLPWREGELFPASATIVTKQRAQWRPAASVRQQSIQKTSAGEDRLWSGAALISASDPKTRVEVVRLGRKGRRCLLRLRGGRGLAACCLLAAPALLTFPLGVRSRPLARRALAQSTRPYRIDSCAAFQPSCGPRQAGSSDGLG